MIQGCPDNDQLLPSYSVLFYNIIATEESQEDIKMGKHCLIPCCNPNCHSRIDGSIIGKKKTPVFRFSADEQECSAWLKAIPLKKEINVKTSVLCERQWPAAYPIISKKGKLRPRNHPSLWPEHPHILPPSCPTKPPSKPRLTKRSSFAVRSEQPDELSLFLETYRVKIEDITERVCASSEPFCCSTTAYNDGEKFVIQSKAREVTGCSTVCGGDRAGSQVCGIPYGNEGERWTIWLFFQLTFTISVWKHSVCHALMKITFIDADFFRQ